VNEPPYTYTEKRAAKRLKRPWREEGDKVTHTHCLRLVRKYASQRNGLSGELFAAMIYTAEMPAGKDVDA
jgi:hypothetical protein